MLDGKVVGRCMQKHRHQEYIRFLNAVEATVPTGKHVHAIVYNYATHKHPKVREWLEAHPWWTFHFTPTSASWLNAVEGFFAKLTKRRLARGIFHSVEELKEAIDRFLAENNQDHPFHNRSPTLIRPSITGGRFSDQLFSAPPLHRRSPQGFIPEV
jgi:transposase